MDLHRSVKAVVPLLLWTLFVWTSRIRNVWTDDDLTTGGQWLRTGYAAVFLVFAIALTVRLWPRRREPVGAADQRLLSVFIAWTVVFWLIRGIGIIVDDHTTSFTVVHTVLMVISLSLAALAGSSADRQYTKFDIR